MPTFENPEKKRKEHLAKAFEAGLDDIENIIGFQGTSLEAIESLVETGRMPGYTGVDNEFMQKGDLHFYPVKSKFEEHSLAETFLDDDKGIETASLYADSIAGEHFLLKKLGIDIGDERYKEDARTLASDFYAPEREEIYKRFIEDGFDKKILDSAIKGAKKRKGVIISLSDKILKKYSPSPGDKNEGDLKINFPDGFDYSYISGLEPVGQEEWEYFEKLQKKD